MNVGILQTVSFGSWEMVGASIESWTATINGLMASILRIIDSADMYNTVSQLKQDKTQERAVML